MSKTKKKKKHRLFWHFFRIQLVLLVLVLTAAAYYFYGGYGKQVEELKQEAVRLVRATPFLCSVLSYNQINPYEKPFFLSVYCVHLTILNILISKLAIFEIINSIFSISFQKYDGFYS